MAESMDGTPAKPNSEVDLNKTECQEEEEVKYIGVRQRKSGKFVSEIGDRKKNDRLWLGTFHSAIEAAKAYDKAAFEIRGRQAKLNFPVDYGLPPEKSATTVVRGCRKRTRDVTVTVAKTSRKPKRDDVAPINAVKSPDGLGLSSPSSSAALVSGPSISPRRRSKPRVTLKWTDQWLCTMCDILTRQIANNGRKSPFNWADLQSELERICQHKFNTVIAIRSKYEAMKARHKLWKSLITGETNLIWNESTGILDCSDDWWEKKIQENPRFKLIRKNQPSRELQEAWDRLFNNLEPCADLNKSNQVHRVNVEDRDERTLHSSQFGNMEAISVLDFVNECGGCNL